MTALGISLRAGVSFSAFVNGRHDPELVPDPHADGIFGVPSTIHVSGSACVVGNRLARVRAVFRGAVAVALNPQAIGSDTVTLVDDSGRGWSAGTLFALFMRKLRSDARTRLNTDCRSVAVAVPTEFDSAQVLMMKAAAVMAGFEEVVLIEEPVAAVEACCMPARDPATQSTLVFDLGCDRLSVTLVRQGSSGRHMMAAVTSSEVSAAEFDKLLVDRLLRQYQRQFPGRAASPATQDMFDTFSADAYALLSTGQRVRVWRALPCDGVVTEVCVTRDQLFEASNPLLDRAIAIADQCLAKGGIDWPNIQSVVLVCSDQIKPLLLGHIAGKSGLQGDCFHHRLSTSAIAYGAALRADQRAARTADEVSAYDIGMRTYDPRSDRIATEWLMRRGDLIPSEVSRRFVLDAQSSEPLTILIVQEMDGRTLMERPAEIDVTNTRNESTPVAVTMRFRFLRGGLLAIEAAVGDGIHMLFDLAEFESNAVAINRQFGFLAQVADY